MLGASVQFLDDVPLTYVPGFLQKILQTGEGFVAHLVLTAVIF